MRIAVIVAGLLLAASVLTPVIVAHRTTIADADWRAPPASVPPSRPATVWPATAEAPPPAR